MSVATTPSATTATWQRLPTSVLPRHYSLSLTVDLVAFAFSGRQRVECEASEQITQITLNAIDLVISDVEAIQSGASIPGRVVYNPSNESVDLLFSSPIAAGPLTLAMNFTGTLGTQLRGLYRSQYTSTVDGSTHLVAVTQFEATDARRAFPCWDEPAIKAQFTVEVKAHKQYTVISNMPEIDTKDADESYVLHRFDRSPIMSTYLVALVVGEFDYVEDKSTTGLPIRVFTPLGKKEQGRFALSVACRGMPLYNDWFGIPYVLPKLDMIAVPDFAAGAMEVNN